MRTSQDEEKKKNFLKTWQKFRQTFDCELPTGVYPVNNCLLIWFRIHLNIYVIEEMTL